MAVEIEELEPEALEQYGRNPIRRPAPRPRDDAALVSGPLIPSSPARPPDGGGEPGPSTSIPDCPARDRGTQTGASPLMALVTILLTW